LYLKFFGLNEAPFSITPDPAFVYLSAAHRDALAHLLYGVGQGGASGFVQLTGEVGTGKTTLCRCLMEQIPDDAQVALVLNPLMTPRELLATICEELGLPTEGVADSNKALVDRLNRYLLDQHARGRRVVVVIDEAQNLSPEALEQVRLLTNLETAKDKLLQMVLLGQPELRELLQRQDLRQLSQRITARYHLAALSRDETFAYVRHRMKVAGAQRIPFRKSALRALYQRSGGVPRLINIIADRALAGAYATETQAVTASMVQAAANEVQPSEKQVHSNPWPAIIATASVLALAVVSLLTVGQPMLDWLRPGKPALSASIVADQAADAVNETVTDPVDGTTPGPAVGGVTKPEPAAPEPLATLDPGWLNEQNSYAWQSLADLWGDEGGADAIRSACDGAVGTGYSCGWENGNWSRIRRLGLPVMLVLRGDQPAMLLFRGFNGEDLLVGRDEQVVEVERDAVESRWLGEYLIVWPQAPGWPGAIQRGESGSAVDIVMEMATFAEPAWIGGDTFDAGFENWLMTFQQRHGLKADGIIGPNTLIYLMAPTITEPRLILQSGEKS
jgi:general secretion pathway protein A